jgi:hypothetical protein
MSPITKWAGNNSIVAQLDAQRAYMELQQAIAAENRRIAENKNRHRIVQEMAKQRHGNNPYTDCGTLDCGTLSTIASFRDHDPQYLGTNFIDHCGSMIETIGGPISSSKYYLQTCTSSKEVYRPHADEIDSIKADTTKEKKFLNFCALKDSIARGFRGRERAKPRRKLGGSYDK